LVNFPKKKRKEKDLSIKKNKSLICWLGGGREILLAEEKSSLGVVNTDFKTNSLIFLSCVHLLLAWRNPLGYLICSLRTLRGDS